jgi:DNA polymerase
MAKKGSTSSRTARAALQVLESLERSGIEQIGKSRGLKAGASAATPQAASSIATPKTVAVPKAAVLSKVATPAAPAPAEPTQSVNVAGDTLELIRQEVAACRRCQELADTRTQTVFGVGNPHARLCFLGEAPGADEDLQGEPFVGRAGQLLTRIIEACTLTRSDVYILNVLKCRPPGNRNPLPDEVGNCRGYLNRQLALIRPEFICCLGTIAAQTLLQTDTPISRLRGKFFDYQGIAVACTYHPAYLLRNPAAKKDVWEDMKALMRKLGIELDKPAAP